MRAWVEFFIKAISGPNSWVGGAQASPIPNKPGWEGYEIKEGPFQLIDQYKVFPNGLLVGNTTVWETSKYGYRQICLCFFYFGYYEKRVHPFLQNVLSRAYNKGLIHGFRGPISDGDDLLYKYTNYIYLSFEQLGSQNEEGYGILIPQTLQLFGPRSEGGVGLEQIITKVDSTLMGYHCYCYFSVSTKD